MKSKDQTLLEEAYKNVVLEGETKNPYDDPFNKLIIRIRHAKKTGDKAKKALAQSELETLAKRHNKMKDPEVLEALDEDYTHIPTEEISRFSEEPSKDIFDAYEEVGMSAEMGMQELITSTVQQILKEVPQEDQASARMAVKGLWINLINNWSSLEGYQD